MDKAETDRARVVAEDLAFLRDEWDQSITDASLRRSSAILRRLLVDNDFGRAWRFLGFDKQPLIATVELSRVLQGVPYRDIVFAHAGGASYQGMTVFGTVVRNRVPSEEEMQARAKFRDATEAQTLSVKKFVDAPIMVVLGTCINRRELILYIANKCGGAHFDSSRQADKPLERKFSLLDQVRAGGLEVAGKKAVYLSLLSVGQNLARAQDAERYISRWSGIQENPG